MSPLGTTPTGDPVTLDLDRLIGSHLGIVANAGGGKSGLIRKLLETTHGQIQHIVLDIEDEFYSLRERLDYVIAGGDGDAPATADNAGALARGALEHGFSLICQLNDLGGEGARDFVRAFIDAMITAPRELWRPCLVVIDETQRFDPDSIRMLTERGRKRGFTAVLASQRLPKIDPNIRGDLNNWIMGRVGQSLDRRIMADQLGMTKAGERELATIQPRHFWAMGPALSADPVLFRVGEVATTMVRPGDAKVPTPPAPEALRAILAGLASAPVVVDQAEGGLGKSEAIMTEVIRLRAELAAERARADQDYDRGKTAGIAIGIARARAAIEALRIPDLVNETAPAALPEGPSAKAVPARRARIVPSAPPAGAADLKAPAGASPAALAIADLLDRVNPARLTWTQAAVLTGRKASGGNFNAARKWLRESGRLVEDGDFILSAAPAPAGLSRDEALDLWRSVLTNPAPRMIDALAVDDDGPVRGVTREELGAAIGAQPRGGNFNSGLAQLRRNGVAVERDGRLELARPLPGEAA